MTEVSSCAVPTRREPVAVAWGATNERLTQGARLVKYHPGNNRFYGKFSNSRQ
jgi:hypothetical protein